MPRKPKRENLKPPGKCIFCGGGGLSKEHIWSEWTYALVPKIPDGRHVRTVTQSSKRNPQIKGIEVEKVHHGSVNTIKIYAVCKTRCNNKWMSQIDEAVKPILSPLILGQPAVLGRDSQRLIATWITMKMMVTEFARRHEVCTRQSERDHLMLNREPPDNWQIWIAHVKGSNWRHGYSRHSSLLGNLDAAGKPIAPDVTLVKNTQSITLGIGELLFLAMSTSLPTLKFQPPADVLRHLRQLWPYGGGFMWPPGTYLADSAAELLARSLSNAVDNLPWDAQ